MNQTPNCSVHKVPMTWKEGGISRLTNKSYDGFWACPAKNFNQQTGKNEYCREKPEMPPVTTQNVAPNPLPDQSPHQGADTDPKHDALWAINATLQEIAHNLRERGDQGPSSEDLGDIPIIQ